MPYFPSAPPTFVRSEPRDFSDIGFPIRELPVDVNLCGAELGFIVRVAKSNSLGTGDLSRAIDRTLPGLACHHLPCLLDRINPKPA